MSAADPTPRERAIARIGLGKVLRLEEGGLRVVDRHPDLHDVLLYETGVESGRIDREKEIQRAAHPALCDLRSALNVLDACTERDPERNAAWMGGGSLPVQATEDARKAWALLNALLNATTTEGGER